MVYPERVCRSIASINRGSVWVPALALASQLLFAAVTRIALGHWPVQGEDAEFLHLGAAPIAATGLIALGATGVFFVALVVWPCSQLMMRKPPDANRVGLFVLPVIAWILLVFSSSRLGEFYGWWWD
jgi:hypothetical protein